MSDRNYYVISDDNCRFPGMTREQIIAAIAEATGNVPEHVDDAFITKIKELNANKQLKFWIGTTAQYVAIEEKEENVLYILTDEAWGDDMEAEITRLSATLNGIVRKNGIVLCSQTIPAGAVDNVYVSEEIDSFTMVKVKHGRASEVICTAYLSEPGVLHILGTGASFDNATVGTYDASMANIHLVITLANHRVLSNLSKVIDYNNGNTTINDLAVHKITGVM